MIHINYPQIPIRTPLPKQNGNQPTLHNYLMIGRRTPQLPHSFSSLYNITYSLSGWRKLILRPGCAHEISLRERIRHDSPAIRGPFKVSIDIAANLLSRSKRPPSTSLTGNRSLTFWNSRSSFSHFHIFHIQLVYYKRIKITKSCRKVRKIRAKISISFYQ